MPFLLPYARIELLIRTMLTRTWAPEAWPVVKHELAKALRLRRHIARAGWWNWTPAGHCSVPRSASSRSNRGSPSCGATMPGPRLWPTQARSAGW